MPDNAPDCFFLWQVSPTVIFGRNQIGSREVDLDFCQRAGIEVYRRKSGGGCVFADPGNIMFSLVSRSRADINSLFTHYVNRIVRMLQSLGIDAYASSRNDILVSGRKVSGNAFYRTPRGSIIHGTMLFDSDLTLMSRALTPSAAKLASKGVPSVSSRVTMLSHHTTLSRPEFISRARAALATAEITLATPDIEAINTLAQPYFSDTWRWGFDRRSTPATPVRIEGAGEFLVDLRLDPASGRVASLNLAGDFLMKADIDSTLIAPLIGRRPEVLDLTEALAGINVADIIENLSTTQFIYLLIS